VLDPDGQLAVVPGLADRAQRWHQHGLHQVDESSPVADQPPRNGTNGCLVTFDQRIVNSSSLAFETCLARGWRSTRGATLAFNGVKFVGGNQVATVDHVCSQASGPHPAVGGLVVHAQAVGCVLQLDLVTSACGHDAQCSQVSTICC
jgi:hypothetical protein